MSTSLFQKNVDKSLLYYGLTIPKDSVESVFSALNIELKKGEKEAIQVLINDKYYDANIIYVDLDKKSPREIIVQIRYGAKSEICSALRGVFSYSYKKVLEQIKKKKKKEKISIDEEYLDVVSLGEKKLEFICHTVEKSSDSSIREVFERFSKEYCSVKKEDFKGNPFGSFVRDDIPQAIFNTDIVDQSNYLVTGSVGQGNWATIPWVCIFDKSITESATKGVYIVYLLSEDGKSLYLTFNQGCTDISHNHTKKETISILRQTANDICEKIDSRGFLTDQNIHLGDHLTDLGVMYEKGTIFYRKYEQGNLPSEDILKADLSKMMDIYNDYVNLIVDKTAGKDEQEKSVKDIIRTIKEYIEAKGFIYPEGMIENLYLSLKSKPFVILAGISGTGKTRLVKLFAEAIRAEYKMVSVRPDWSDSSDLFGYVDLNGHYVPGAILEYISQANNHPDKPYILCLDEMNLARVEYYLSDFLSIIETREFVNGSITSSPLVSSDKYGTDNDAKIKYGDITFPSNLYVVGTVNMDETTFPFSKKVLDRANTIEFNDVNLVNNNQRPEEKETIEVSNSFLSTNYLFLANCMDEEEYVSEVCAELEGINNILKTVNAHIGYRVRDEIVFYMLNNKNTGLLPEEEAFDNEIMQKILPRIQGSQAYIKDMLCELFKAFAGDYEGYQTQSNNTASRMIKKLETEKVKYLKSAEKIAFMVRRFEEDGFTTYWI